MIPVTFPEQNTTFGKPEEMTDDECQPLPAFMGPDAAGYPVIISCWQLTPEEIKQISETGNLWCVVVGKGLPPMSFHTVKPFNP